MEDGDRSNLMSIGSCREDDADCAMVTIDDSDVDEKMITIKKWDDDDDHDQEKQGHLIVIGEKSQKAGGAI